MLLQLNPKIPVYIPEFDAEGYAFLVNETHEEDYLYFTVALDNGEIWILDNRRVRFCVNRTKSRNKINKLNKSEYIK